VAAIVEGELKKGLEQPGYCGVGRAPLVRLCGTVLGMDSETKKRGVAIDERFGSP
jgi:hypothetical protein